MKVNRKNLNNALCLVNKIAVKTSSYGTDWPTGVLVECGPQQLDVRVTDLETSLSLNLPSPDESEGSAVVSARSLKAIVTKLKGASLDVSIDEGAVVIKAGKRTLRVPRLMDPDEYPALQSCDKLSPAMTLEADGFADQLDRVLYAVSTDETRQHLHGVKFETQDTAGNSTRLRLIATDGHRMSIAEGPIAAGFHSADCVVSPTCLRVLRQSIKVAKPELLQQSHDGDRFTTDLVSDAWSMRITGAVRQSKFPPWEKVVPSEWQTWVVVAREDLAAAVKLAKGLVDKHNSPLGMTFNGSLSLVARDSMENEIYSESIEAEIDKADKTADDLEISFNAQYLHDAIAPLTSDELYLRFCEELDPVVIKQHSRPEAGCAVVMPLRA